jgi:hypothetical protein
MKKLIKRLLGITKLEEELAASQAEADRLSSLIKGHEEMLNARFEGEWKTTKDGRRRYRKVKTVILADIWRTESVPVDI